MSEFSLKKKNSRIKSPIYLPPRSIQPEEANWNLLTPKQAKFLEQFAICRDIDKACELADCSRHTLNVHWAKNDNFRACFAQVQLDIIKTIREIARTYAPEAVATVAELMKQDSDRRTQLQAARTMLEIANAYGGGETKTPGWGELKIQLAQVYQTVFSGGEVVSEKVYQLEDYSDEQEIELLEELEGRFRHEE